MIIGALEFLSQKLLDQAEKELYDADTVHQEMAEAYALVESGGISDEEFERREQQLVERLEVIEARRRAAAGEEEDEDNDEEDEEDEDSDEDEDEGFDRESYDDNERYALDEDEDEHDEDETDELVSNEDQLGGRAA